MTMTMTRKKSKTVPVGAKKAVLAAYPETTPRTLSLRPNCRATAPMPGKFLRVRVRVCHVSPEISIGYYMPRIYRVIACRRSETCRDC